MVPAVVTPLVAAIALAVVVTTVHRWLPPVLATRALVVTTVVVAGAALPTLWILSLGYVAHLRLFAGFEWCAHVFGVHQRVPWWLGLPSLLVVAAGSARVARVVRSHRRLREDHHGSVEIAGHDQPFAFTLPGRAGHIVLSSGLVELLDEQEQQVVLAHERAHARHRHDRYLFVAQSAAATLPFLRPLASRLQFAIERWADEAAVHACGDRRFVARTLGKVALHGVTPVAVPGFAGLGVPARVAALLAPAPTAPSRPLLLTMWSAIAVTAVLAAFQLHHLIGLITALCPG